MGPRPPFIVIETNRKSFSCDTSPDGGDSSATEDSEPLSRSMLLARDERSTSEPVAILPYLYLGNESHASHLALLRRLGITAILNVSTTCPNRFQDCFQYLSIPVADTSQEDISSWFQDSIDFIGKCLSLTVVINFSFAQLLNLFSSIDILVTRTI